MGDRHQSPSSGPDGPVFPNRAGSGEVVSAMRKLIVAILRLYKGFVSPLLPSACRYYPSCSEYTRQAVERFGVATGLWMGAKRLSRCHPFHAGGLDPVPELDVRSWMLEVGKNRYPPT